MAFMEVNCFSETLEMCVHFGVILPQRETSGEIGIGSKRAQNYPVLYLLHGLSDDETIWMRRTSIERYATEAGFAVVMPTTFRGWYLDTPAAKYETYIGDELPKLVAEFFPSISTAREDTYIAGLSMGGFGAMHFGLKRPAQYAGVAALSGAFDLARPERMEHLLREGVLAGNPTGTDADVYYLAKELGKTKGAVPDFYLWCGTEDELLEDSHRMLDTLCEAQLPVTYSEYSGNHSWGYWDAQILQVLNWIEELRNPKEE